MVFDYESDSENDCSATWTLSVADRSNTPLPHELGLGDRRAVGQRAL